MPISSIANRTPAGRISPGSVIVSSDSSADGTRKQASMTTLYTDEIPVEQVEKQSHLEPMAAYSPRGPASGARSPIKQRFVSLFLQSRAQRRRSKSNQIEPD